MRLRRSLELTKYFFSVPLDGLGFFSWLCLVVLISGGQPNSC